MNIRQRKASVSKKFLLALQKFTAVDKCRSDRVDVPVGRGGQDHHFQ